MPSITIKGIPDEVYHRLKKSAEANRRSLNSEIIRKLEQSVQSHQFNAESFLRRLGTLRQSHPVASLTDRMLKEGKSKGRP